LLDDRDLRAELWVRQRPLELAHQQHEDITVVEAPVAEAEQDLADARACQRLTESISDQRAVSEAELRRRRMATNAEARLRRARVSGGVHVKYMLLICIYEPVMRETVGQEYYAESVSLAHRLKRHGQYPATNPLRPPSAADGVRVRDGKVLVTDGPFAETREQLGG
jgi:YCII-related domain